MLNNDVRRWRLGKWDHPTNGERKIIVSHHRNAKANSSQDAGLMIPPS